MPFKNIKMLLEFLKYTSKIYSLQRIRIFFFFWTVIVFAFESGSYYESLAGLELREVHLPLPPKSHASTPSLIHITCAWELLY